MSTNLLKKLTLGLILLLLFSYIIPAENIKNLNFEKTSLPESHLIPNVPYVGQYDNFHCAFATRTMLINYFGKNTTLEEVIFLLGNAYSLYISNISRARIPTPGFLLCQKAIESEFVGNLFGLSYDFSYEGDGYFTCQDHWESYWKKLKENISQNIPIETSVSPFKLSTIEDIYNINDFIRNRLNGGHGIVIVGYNESNQTVCYNDPATLYYGKPSVGKYAWMEINELKNAVETTYGTKYLITRYQNISHKLPRNTLLKEAGLNNINKMKGVNNTYTISDIDTTDNCRLGTEAVKSINGFYNKGLNKRTRTILRYKLDGFLGLQYNLIFLIEKSFPNLLDDLPVDYQLLLTNTFDYIALDKIMAADYLKNHTKNTSAFQLHSEKLRYEAENWTKIADLYRDFKIKGLFMRRSKAIETISEMQKIIENIIKIEKEIIEIDYF